MQIHWQREAITNTFHKKMGFFQTFYVLAEIHSCTNMQMLLRTPGMFTQHIIYASYASKETSATAGKETILPNFKLTTITQQQGCIK